MSTRHLNPVTRFLLDGLPAEETALILDLAFNVMVSIEDWPGHDEGYSARLGENGAVELVIKTILFFSERGTSHE